MKAVALLSGGMDSAVMVADLLAGGFDVEALSFDYGQRHALELDAARAVAAHYGIAQRILKVALHELAPTSSQTNAEIAVPLGHYADESMRVTVVPNRNMVMLALAISRAIAADSRIVAYACHQGDHAIYPDCRPRFVDAMREAARLCDYLPVQIVTPFLEMTKAQIASVGAALAVPFHLTYSCYQGKAKHCGECGTCVERREAFDLAGISDPTEYLCRPVPAA
jgi:7-cyano-7-deazaguanine synthase